MYGEEYSFKNLRSKGNKTKYDSKQDEAKKFSRPKKRLNIRIKYPKQFLANDTDE